MGRSDQQKKTPQTEESHACVQHSEGSSSQKRIEEEDNWVTVRVIMDFGAAGDLMLAGIFPHVKLEHKTAPKEFFWKLLVNHSEAWVRRLFHSRHTRKFNRCTTLSAVKLLISMQKVVRVGNMLVMDDENPLIRSARYGTVIKLDANN